MKASTNAPTKATPPTTIVTGLWIWRAGTILAEAGSIWHGRRGDPFDVPVTWLILDTIDGPWLIDCGFAPEIAVDAAGYLGPASQRVRFAPAETLGRRLEEAGIESEPIAGVILTHLHYDHAGGLRELFPGTPVWIHEDELAAYRSASKRRSYYPADLERSRDLRTYRGDYSPAPGIDIIETPGHSAGHVSVVVDLGTGRYVVTGDAAPTVRNITDRLLPGLHVDAAAAERSLDRVIQLVRSGAQPIPSHDPDFWRDDLEPVRRLVAGY